MKTVVVTGSAGFLGSHLCEYYLNSGYIVIGIDNFLTGQIQNVELLKNKFKDNYIFFDQNICDSLTDLENIISANNLVVEFVFHFASAASVPHYQKYSLETMAANSTGLLNCLEFSQKMKTRVIFASTSEIYGDPQISPQPESYWGHVNPYGERSCYDEAKRYGEALIYSWNKRYCTQHGIIRIFNTYGPRMNLDDGRVILRMMQQALKNEPLTIYGSGEQTRSFCYVDDLIAGIIKYAQSDHFLPMNLGRAETIKIRDLALQIQKITNSSSKIEFCNLPSDDPNQRTPDLTFSEKIKYVPTHSLESGLKKLLEWFHISKDQNDY